MNLLNRYDTSNIECKLQFIISERAFKLPIDFDLHEINGFYLGIHRQQKVIRALDSSGETIGCFLGLVIELDKEVVITSDIVIERSLSVKDVACLLDGFAGSYVFIYLTEFEKRIYLDADGTMSLVYDPSRKIAGSTAAVILDESSYFNKLNSDLFRDLDVLNFGWFPSGLTAHQGIERLLCNFFLDLTTWECKRFWPIKPFSYSTDSQYQVETICDNTKKTLKSLTKAYQVQQSLTAGYETRFLLSCCKDIRDQISFFTVASTKIDRDIAKLLSGKFSLKHVEIPKILTTEKQQQDWLFRAGHAIGGTNLTTHASINHFNQHTVLSIGLGGEVGRGFLWKKGDRPDNKVTAELLIGRFGLPTENRLLESTALWLGTLPPGLDFFSILDLAYLELRMSAWAYAQAYAQDAICLHISPMISYRNYKAMFDISPESKLRNPFLYSGIMRNWPSLLEVPINRYGDWRDLFTLIRKASNPVRVISKIRKLLSQ